MNEWLADLRRSESPQFVVDPWWRWLDPDRLATVVVRADPTALCRAVIERVGRRDPDPAWSEGWRAAEAAAQSALTAALEPDPNNGGDSGALTEWALSESALARRLYRALPSEATMVVSSSMPVRDVEAFAPPRSSPPSCWPTAAQMASTEWCPRRWAWPWAAAARRWRWSAIWPSCTTARPWSGPLASTCPAPSLWLTTGEGGSSPSCPQPLPWRHRRSRISSARRRPATWPRSPVGSVCPWPMLATLTRRCRRSGDRWRPAGCRWSACASPGAAENVEGHRRVNQSVVAAVERQSAR